MTVNAIAHRLDTVRDLLARDNLSVWAREYWTAVESRLVAYWKVANKEYL